MKRKGTYELRIYNIKIFTFFKPLSQQVNIHKTIIHSWELFQVKLFNHGPVPWIREKAPRTICYYLVLNIENQTIIEGCLKSMTYVFDSKYSESWSKIRWHTFIIKKYLCTSVIKGCIFNSLGQDWTSSVLNPLTSPLKFILSLILSCWRCSTKPNAYAVGSSLPSPNCTTSPWITFVLSRNLQKTTIQMKQGYCKQTSTRTSSICFE